MQLSQARPPQLLQIHLFILIVLWLPPHHLPFGFLSLTVSVSGCHHQQFAHHHHLNDWTIEDLIVSIESSPSRQLGIRRRAFSNDTATLRRAN